MAAIARLQPEDGGGFSAVLPGAFHMARHFTKCFGDVEFAAGLSRALSAFKGCAVLKKVWVS